MLEKYLIQTNGFRNFPEGNEVAGFEVKIRLAYYRGIALTIIGALKLIVDGKVFEGSSLRLGIGKKFYTMEEAAREEVARWEFDSPAVLRVYHRGGLAVGAHEISLVEVIKPSYIPGAGFVGEATKVITLVDGASPSARSSILLGVSLYSYQEEFYTHSMNLADCVAEVAAIGAEGVQLIPEQMMHGYPNPGAVWISRWHELLETYNLRPTLMDTFVDVSCGGHRKLTLQEGVDQLIVQMKLAKTLGFDVIRPTTGPVADSAPDLIEKALPHAEELDVRIAPELHAPITLRGKYIDSYMELIARTGTRHLGFTLDFGVFCHRIPPAAVAYARRQGANERIVEFIDKAFIDGEPMDQVHREVDKMSPNPADRYLASRYRAYGPSTNRVADLKPILPYIFNAHGKFYEINDEGQEESIDYKAVIEALVAGGYRGSIDSEYEGQRLTQDAFVTDSCEQVRRQHYLMRSVLSRRA
jgi:sugar phosphate isomerase/epimerase